LERRSDLQCAIRAHRRRPAQGGAAGGGEDDELKRLRERVRCSSLVDWPVYRRLRRTMRGSEWARNSGRLSLAATLALYFFAPPAVLACSVCTLRQVQSGGTDPALTRRRGRQRRHSPRSCLAASLARRARQRKASADDGSARSCRRSPLGPPCCRGRWHVVAGHGSSAAISGIFYFPPPPRGLCSAPRG
jgi:hypothetical protein